MNSRVAIAGPAQTALVNIQYLRAIAAMMVVWVHAREQFDWLKLQFPSPAGGNGVDLFFVISGFIMVYTTYGKAVAPLAFIKRRFLRIAPLYWLAILFILVVSFVAPSVLKSTVIQPAHVLASFMFWPSPSPKFPAEMWPLLVPGWTLNYEMAFYVLFGLTLCAPMAWRVFLLCASLVLVVLSGIGLSATGVLRFYTDAIVLTFGAGALLGHLYCKGRIPQSVTLGWGLVVTGIALWWGLQSVDTGHRVIGAGIPAVLLVTGACALPSIDGKWLDWLRQLGDASYSIYIGHIFILGGLGFAWSRIYRRVDNNIDGVVFLTASILVCGMAGVLIYRLAEKPMNRWMSRKN